MKSYSFYLVPLCCVLLVVVACGSGQKKAVLGKWIGQKGSIEFFEDGTAQLSMSRRSGFKKYTFIEGNRIRLDSSEGVSSDSLLMEFQDLTDKISLVLSNGDAIEFFRVTENRNIVGKWKEFRAESTDKAVKDIVNGYLLFPEETEVEQEKNTIEFLGDGSVKVVDSYPEDAKHGTYVFLGKNHVSIKTNNRSEVFAAQLTQNTLSLDEMDSSGNPEGNQDKYIRVSHLEESVKSILQRLESNGKIQEFKMKAWEAIAIRNLSLIRICQESYRAENDVYLECKPHPVGGGTDAVPDVWDDGSDHSGYRERKRNGTMTGFDGFSGIGFSPYRSDPYQYAVKVQGRNRDPSFIATAVGDLNENGVKVVYTVTNSDHEPQKQPKDEY